MKEQIYQPAKTHHSEVLDEFLSLGTPEELARTESRMMLAAKIQDAMTAKGIGKKQLADIMGQSPSVITKWLSGGHNFTIDTLTDIQRILNVRLLALGEKPVIQKIYRITLKVEVASSQAYNVFSPMGQSFYLPAIQTSKTKVSRENLKRESAFA